MRRDNFSNADIKWMSRRLSNIKQKAKLRKISFDLKTKDYIELRRNWKCYYCGGVSVFSIDRKDNDIGYTKDNVVACCYSCNSLKSNRFSESEMFKLLDFIKTLKNI